MRPVVSQVVVSLALAAVLAPAVAAADEPSYTVEAQLRHTDLGGAAVTFALDPAAPRQLHWSAFAQTTAEGLRTGPRSAAASVDAAAGAELVYEAAGCRFVVVGGQARVSSAGGAAALSGEQWLDLCVWKSWLLSFELGHHLELGVRPGLAAPRNLRRRAFSRETIHFTYKMIDVPVPEHDFRILFGAVTPRIGVLWQDDAAAAGHQQVSAVVDFDTFRWIRARTAPFADAELSVDVLKVRIQEIDNVRYALAVELVPLRLAGVRLGTPAVVLDAEAGWGQATLGMSSNPANPTDLMATTITLRRVDAMTGRLAVRGGNRALTGGVGFARTLYPTVSDEVALEDRLSASVDVPLDGARATLGVRLFGARTMVWAETGPVATDLTGGGAVEAGLDLGHSLRFTGSAEIARSFYANLDGDLAPRSELGVRALGVLSARFGGTR